MSEGRMTLGDRRTLAWRTYGPDDGHPVLWFHGTPGSRNSRHADESVYHRLRVHLVVFDRPGYGASSRLAGRGIAAIADDAAELLNELGVASVHVGGVSGGGPHALAFASRHPVRVQAATVVVGAAPKQEEDLAGLIEFNRASWYAAREGWDALYAHLAPERQKMLADPLAGFRATMDAAPPRDKAVMADPAWQRVFVESVTEALSPGVEGWVDEGMALNLPWDFEPSEARCNITWWHGEHDANVPISAVRRLVASMSDIDLRVWSGAGHLEGYHRYEEMLAELLAR